MKKHEPLFVCDSCDNECNCHPSGELQVNGDKLICGNCADDLTEEEFNNLVKFVPGYKTELAEALEQLSDVKFLQDGTVLANAALKSDLAEFQSLCERLDDALMNKHKELAEARAENNVLKAALWYYGNQRGPNVIEELKQGLPEKIWRKINLKEIEETDGEAAE